MAAMAAAMVSHFLLPLCLSIVSVGDSFIGNAGSSCCGSCATSRFSSCSILLSAAPSSISSAGSTGSTIVVAAGSGCIILSSISLSCSMVIASQSTTGLNCEKGALISSARSLSGTKTTSLPWSPFVVLKVPKPLIFTDLPSMSSFEMTVNSSCKNSSLMRSVVLAFSAKSSTNCGNAIFSFMIG